jgi:hypothetical protein
MLMVIFLWIGVSTLVVYGPAKLFGWLEPIGRWLTHTDADSWVAALTGIITVATGLSSALSGASSQTPGSPEQEKKPGFGFSWIKLRLIAPLFAILLIVLLSWLTTELLLLLPAGWGGVRSDALQTVYEPIAFRHMSVLHGTHLRVILAFTAFMSGVVAYFVNINKFSLHAIYRDRLILTYLGASRRPDERTPVNFTGFDEHDNLEMHELRSAKLENGQRLFHVLNIALNLVNSKNLAWQERKAESFTVSPLHAGSHRLGYRDTQLYGHDRHVKKSITLGTAMGEEEYPMLGLAAAPEMARLLVRFAERL